MKAIRLHSRGGTEKMIYQDAPLPTLLPGDALVRVLASGVRRYPATVRGKTAFEKVVEPGKQGKVVLQVV